MTHHDCERMDKINNGFYSTRVSIDKWFSGICVYAWELTVQQIEFDKTEETSCEIIYCPFCGEELK
jgi:hypothetical protein